MALPAGEARRRGAEGEDAAAGVDRAAVRPLAWVAELGYGAARIAGDAGVCAVRRLMFTGAIYVGITKDTYLGRYCYATVGEALSALQAWDGSGDPPGNWIKFKGASSERLGPGIVADLENVAAARRRGEASR